MKHRCFISFKTEDLWYKEYIQKYLDVDMIDRSLNEPIDSDNLDYVMRVIRQNYLSDSTVTLFLIGVRSNENLGAYEQRYIKRELQGSLYNGVGNTQNGILGIVLPTMYNDIYKGSYECVICGGSHTNIGINNATVISEFGYNYFIPNGKCSWSEDERYCVLVKWDDFIENAEKYIEEAFAKRTATISKNTMVRP